MNKKQRHKYLLQLQDILLDRLQLIGINASFKIEDENLASTLNIKYVVDGMQHQLSYLFTEFEMQDIEVKKWADVIIQTIIVEIKPDDVLYSVY